MLYDPQYTVNAIVFHGRDINIKEFKRLKIDMDWLLEKNNGIKPKIVLFLEVEYITIIF